MPTKKRLKEVKSKKEEKLIPSKERWKQYEYATSFVVFSHEPLSNNFSDEELTYGACVILKDWKSKSNAVEHVIKSLGTTLGVICGYIKEEIKKKEK